MKTAMQKLLEWHRKSMRSYSETNKMIEALLEKEKEQMIGCCLVGYLFEDGEDTNPFELAEKFYNQTYNQNK